MHLHMVQLRRSCAAWGQHAVIGGHLRSSKKRMIRSILRVQKYPKVNLIAESPRFLDESEVDYVRVLGIWPI